jgi:hypothetical protein
LRPPILPAGSSQAWVWAACEGPVVGATVSAVLAGGRAWATVGHAHPGTAGFARTHVEARAAQRVALAGGPCATATAYDEVEVLGLLSRDEGGMCELIAHELSGLAAAGPGARSCAKRRSRTCDPERARPPAPACSAPTRPPSGCGWSGSSSCAERRWTSARRSLQLALMLAAAFGVE